jgi:hypothetical protein
MRQHASAYVSTRREIDAHTDSGMLVELQSGKSAVDGARGALCNAAKQAALRGWWHYVEHCRQSRRLKLRVYDTSDSEFESESET